MFSSRLKTLFIKNLKFWFEAQPFIKIKFITKIISYYYVYFTILFLVLKENQIIMKMQISTNSLMLSCVILVFQIPCHIIPLSIKSEIINRFIANGF